MNNFLKYIAGTLVAVTLVASAQARPDPTKSWSVHCKDGTVSASKISLGMAICGCVNRGGSIEYPRMGCGGMSQGGPVKTGGATAKQ